MLVSGAVSCDGLTITWGGLMVRRWQLRGASVRKRGSDKDVKPPVHKVDPPTARVVARAYLVRDEANEPRALGRM